METPQNTTIGETLLFDIVEALGKSPQWNSTLLFINFDEHGGYYDHVYPPRALAPDDIAPVVPAGGCA
jgi:phospholipase C